MRKPRALELYCGAGGSAMGYARAGFDVVGVDAEPQPDFPFEFHQDDALAFLDENGHEFDFISGGPPCQIHSPISRYSSKTRKRELIDLIPQTRAALEFLGLPYVIENVWTKSAGLINPVMLCGTQFGLNLFRHRGFESDLSLAGLPHRHLRGQVAIRNGYLPTEERPFMTITGRNGHHSKAWQRKAAEYMGTPWITSLNGVCEAIPPAYTEFIGRQVMSHMGWSR